MATYEVLPTAQLTIDPLYQRVINPGGRKRIAAIAADWQPKLAGVLEVSHRNGAGGYAVMDGQHRLLAARDAGITELPCLVHTGLSVLEESELFEKLNTLPVKPKMNDIFRSQLVSGNPHARAVVAAVTGRGLKVSLTHSSDANTLQSVGTLMAIEMAVGQAALESALDIIKAAWPGDNDRWNSYLLTGVAGFEFYYGKHPDYDRKRLIKGLQAATAKVVVNRIYAAGQASLTSAGPVGGYAKISRPASRIVLLNMYNYRLRVAPLPELNGSDIYAIARGGNPWAK